MFRRLFGWMIRPNLQSQWTGNYVYKQRYVYPQVPFEGSGGATYSRPILPLQPGTYTAGPLVIPYDPTVIGNTPGSFGSQPLSPTPQV